MPMQHIGEATKQSLDRGGEAIHEWQITNTRIRANALKQIGFIYRSESWLGHSSIRGIFVDGFHTLNKISQSIRVITQLSYNSIRSPDRRASSLFTTEKQTLEAGEKS
jgi:hypothetical protein